MRLDEGATENFHATSGGRMSSNELDRLCINTIRTLAIDAI